MSESNCECCACQYSTPPWWVTMGFIPPYGYQGSGGSTGRATLPIGGGSGTPTGTGTPAQPAGNNQQSSGSSNPLTGILNTVLGPIGGLLGGLGL